MDFLKLRHVPPSWQNVLSYGWSFAASAWIAAAISLLRV
jgi:hypothetical protein